MQSFIIPYFRLKISVKPRSLKPNDKVAILAPSGRVFESELQANLNFLRKMELHPVFGNYVFEDYFNGYHYAGNPEQRTADLQWALDDDEIKAIWFARGGYGAVQLLDKIDWTKFKQNPKWLIGYSDITALHNPINNWNIQSLHAITVKRLNCAYTQESFESLQTVLIGERLSYEIDSHPLNKVGSVKGKLVGGNLSLLYSLTGSSAEIQGEDLVLFIEDWNENWYHLDRMLMNLKRSGLLSRINGLLVGSFTRMDIQEENPDFLSEYDATSYQIIHKFMHEFEIPIGFGFPSGHIGDNRALIFGSEVELTITQKKLNLEFT